MNPRKRLGSSSWFLERRFLLRRLRRLTSLGWLIPLLGGSCTIRWRSRRGKLWLQLPSSRNVNPVVLGTQPQAIRRSRSCLGIILLFVVILMISVMFLVFFDVWTVIVIVIRLFTFFIVCIGFFVRSPVFARNLNILDSVTHFHRVEPGEARQGEVTITHYSSEV